MSLHNICPRCHFLFDSHYGPVSICRDRNHMDTWHVPVGKNDQLIRIGYAACALLSFISSDIVTSEWRFKNRSTYIRAVREASACKVLSKTIADAVLVGVFE